MFDGLYFFEWVLMALGVILFVVLVIGFFYQLTHKRSIGVLLAFFVVDIAMIGYPSVKSIEINNGVVNIQKQTDAVLADPTDSKARADLQQQVEKLNSRPVSDPSALTSLSRAEFALGNEPAAKAKLDKALQKKPDLPQAAELKSKIESLDRLAPLTAKVESNPADEKAKAELTQTLKVVNQQPVANPSAILKVAQAQAALGDHASAEKNTAIVRKINPKMVMKVPTGK
jgi:tetratricopeptide (TPR) repeat protein